MVHLKEEFAKKKEKFEKEIAELEAKLEKCKAYQGSSPKSEFMRKCLNEASKLKWRKACEDLFSNSQESPIFDAWNKLF